MKASFHRLLFKKGGERATWEYPFAVAGINVSFMLIQMLDLDSGLFTYIRNSLYNGPSCQKEGTGSLGHYMEIDHSICGCSTARSIKT